MDVGEQVVNYVMCSLVDPEGSTLEASVSLPQHCGPKHLTQFVNKHLNNEEKLPYAFYIADQELVTDLGSYLDNNKDSVEKVLTIVYQPQAVFRIRPVHRCSATIAGHTEAVISVAFSPDGRHLASGSGDTTVRFWDLNTQTPMHTCNGHRNWVLCIAWSPDGKYLVSGSKAGELICWDPQTGKPSGSPLVGHNKWITAISWEPLHLNAPARRFVSSSKDGNARIWDSVTKKCVVCLSGHTLSVTCVKWGGDGMIFTSSQDCTIKVWETSQGKLIRELKGHGHWVNSLALSTEYVLRTGAFDHTCKQYFSPEEMKEVALQRYTKMKGSAPERLVSGSDDFTMFLWEPSVNKHPKTRMTGHQQLVNHVYFSPDGQWVASASFDKSVKLWNGVTGQYIAAFRGHVGPVYQISWSADSRLLLSGSKDSTLKVWDIRTKKLKQDLPGHADEDCTIKVWETSQGKLIRELKGHGHWVNSLALSTEYVLRTGAFDHTGKQYFSPEEMKEVALQRYTKMKGSAPERLVSGSDDFTMFLWEPSVNKHPKTRMTGHQQLVNHVYFSPDGQWVASASFDKSVKLWNGVTGQYIAAFRGHVGPVYQISWSADSRLLLSGSKDSTLKVWDIRTKKLKQDLPGHADEVFSVDWSPDGEKVASGGKDRLLKLWMG